MPDMTKYTLKTKIPSFQCPPCNCPTAGSNVKDNAKDKAKDNAKDKTKDNTKDNATEYAEDDTPKATVSATGGARPCDVSPSPYQAAYSSLNGYHTDPVIRVDSDRDGNSANTY